MSGSTERQRVKPRREPHSGPVAGVIFDMDGTLVDSGLDFAAMRREMGLPDGVPLLEAMEDLAEAEAIRCRAILLRHEAAGAARAVVLPGVRCFLDRLRGLGVRQAVFTRNSREVADATLTRCRLDFELVMTRDDGPIKPDPWAIRHICATWGVVPAQVAVIGDYRFDIEAGIRAGARTVLFTRGRPSESLPGADLAEFHLASFQQADQLLRALGL
ncbi:HAD family hydrolase [Methylocaldum sp. RMAD-M]|uniref:HAD family hydrolase n=1 Tax=Methylocaldum sp. RMAD-M TaxID=2806557 RepID=UPI000A32AB81|nr:HAD family hydrolase [Methylocaldum sp. RMAD-M]MBP1151394.1 HAD superfamily hydrolase (TIGR01509 family) [Methylocaldum sp. RMAD-M]